MNRLDRAMARERSALDDVELELLAAEGLLARLCSCDGGEPIIDEDDVDHDDLVAIHETHEGLQQARETLADAREEVATSTAIADFLEATS